MGTLLEYGKANAMLGRYGIRSVGGAYLSSPEQAVKFSAGRPIALKALTPKALHKTKSGLIALNVSGEKDIGAAFRRLSRKAARYKGFRILGQHMVAGGIEIIIGGKTDPQFGKLVLIGLGGIYVETFRDFALRVCPINKYDANEMIDQLRSRRIIAPGARQRAMLVKLLLSVSRMFCGNKIDELDLNPIILHDGTYDAVDIRILK